MLYFRHNPRSRSLIRLGLVMVLAVSFTMVGLCDDTHAAAKGKIVLKAFASPDEAFKGLIQACRAGDQAALLAMLGPEGKMLAVSGDPIVDKEDIGRFVTAYDTKNAVVMDGDARAILEVGTQAWPLPIPVVKTAGGWSFDVRQGYDELLNRRIGKNELNAIQVCLAYVDAQREYAAKDRTGAGTLQFAQKFVSDEGKKNGLYWHAAPGEEQSPLGPFAAAARDEGYTKKAAQAVPYHGYFYKILKAQGKHATGGARGYVVKGKMIGGFALVAWPARYGSSGIMSFIVNHEGIVYEKNLGGNTRAAAKGMKAFDPDKTWKKVDPKHLEVTAKAN